MAVKSGEERLKEMEAEMALFEQEVLGGPVPISGSPPVMDPGAVALAVPVISLVRPIIGTNTYRQVQQTLEARAASFVGPPPTFVGPVPSIRSPPPPIMRPAFVPHILQRPSGPIPHGPPQPMQHIAASPQVGDIVPMVPAPPRSVGPPSLKPTPSIIQAAPTVYSAPPVTVGHKRVDPQAQRQARMWESDDFRIFCGDLGNEVNDDILARTFSRYPSFLKAKVVRDKRTGKTKGYGFVSFKDPNDYVRAMREMNGKYVGSRPIKLRKSMWKDRNIEVVRKKQKEKKKLGLR
uniref:RNA-binding protein 42 n=1 Tax=Nothobranchius rachovii TaxID=451742 RepID=A0A1A8RCJ9_9TELE